VFDLLHHVDELFEADVPTGVRIHVLHEIADLAGVTLEASHDCLEVFHLDVTSFLLVEQIEYFLEIIYFFICKCRNALLRMLIRDML
jgi:hypothetical protein